MPSACFQCVNTLLLTSATCQGMSLHDDGIADLAPYFFVFSVKKGGGGLGGVGENCYICEITNFPNLNNYAQQNYRCRCAGHRRHHGDYRNHARLGQSSGDCGTPRHCREGEFGTCAVRYQRGWFSIPQQDGGGEHVACRHQEGGRSLRPSHSHRHACLRRGGEARFAESLHDYGRTVARRLGAQHQGRTAHGDTCARVET